MDLSGQRATPFDGVRHRPDVEVPKKAVMDALVDRPEVNVDRITTYSVGGGSAIILRAAAFEKRTSACVASTAMHERGVPAPDCASSCSHWS